MAWTRSSSSDKRVLQPAVLAEIPTWRNEWSGFLQLVPSQLVAPQPLPDGGKRPLIIRDHGFRLSDGRPSIGNGELCVLLDELGFH